MKRGSNLYITLADAVVLLHFLWTFLVFGGAIVMILWPGYAIPQIIIVSITLLSNVPFKFECPLTILERKFRRKANPSYKAEHSFMTIYTNRIFGTRMTQRTMNIAIGVLYTSFYAYAILTLIYR